MILLKYRDIEAKSPVVVSCRPEGIFRFRLWNEHGVKLQGRVGNLITNGGLDKLTAGSACQYCHVGTGTNAPAFSDTALGNFSASSNTAPPGSTQITGAYVAGTPDYTYGTKLYRFAAGVATGNLTEVGTSSTAASGNLFSRALFLNEELDPIVISKGAIDVLDIEYELRLYPQWDDVAGTLVIGGVSRDFVVRACSVQTAVANGDQWNIWQPMSGSSNTLFRGDPGRSTAFTTDLVPRTTAVTSAGGLDTQTTGTRSTYVNGTRYSDLTTTFGIDFGNVGAPGIRRVSFRSNAFTGNNAAFQCRFDPVLAKDNTKSLTLTLRVSWDRV